MLRTVSPVAVWFAIQVVASACGEAASEPEASHSSGGVGGTGGAARAGSSGDFGGLAGEPSMAGDGGATLGGQTGAVGGHEEPAEGGADVGTGPGGRGSAGTNGQTGGEIGSAGAPCSDEERSCDGNPTCRPRICGSSCNPIPGFPGPPRSWVTSGESAAQITLLENEENARALATADFDGDGRSDVAIVNEKASTAEIFLSRGSALSLVDRDDTGLTPTGIAVGDVDGDGTLDLVTTDSGADTVSVLSGHGDGEFTLVQTHAVATDPRGVALGDLDGDGALEIVVASAKAGTVNILWNEGAEFTREDVPAGAAPNSVALGDVNGDDRPDIAVGDDEDAVVLFFNTESNAFDLPAAMLGASGRIALNDFNQDGIVDIALADEGYGTLLYRYEQGGAVYRNTLGHTYSGSPAFVAADLTGDDMLDWVLRAVPATDGQGKHRMRINLSGGVSPTLSALNYPRNADEALAIASGDMNGDGRTDLVLATRRTLELRLNTCLPCGAIAREDSRWRLRVIAETEGSDKCHVADFRSIAPIDLPSIAELPSEDASTCHVIPGTDVIPYPTRVVSDGCRPPIAALESGTVTCGIRYPPVCGGILLVSLIPRDSQPLDWDESVITGLLLRLEDQGGRQCLVFPSGCTDEYEVVLERVSEIDAP